MLGSLFSKKKSSDIPEKLYLAVSSQARNPVFFTDYGFEDTVMGRFDCLSLHVMLLANRLAHGGHAFFGDLNQEIYDCFVNELDVAIREIGIGDTVVHKRKKKMVRTFYGTISDFDEALQKSDRTSLVTNANQRYFNNENGQLSEKLADYMLSAHNHLGAITDDELIRGKLNWPNP